LRKVLPPNPNARNYIERVEVGDRGIEPLYPSFLTSEGPAEVLREPLYSQLKDALINALKEQRIRPALQRALMQSDMWAAYDLIYHVFRPMPADGVDFLPHRAELLPLMARFIQKLALTPGEVGSLPKNYHVAASLSDLPKLFDPASGWLEVEWRQTREHDLTAGDRRSTRVFVKPSQKPRDVQGFLDSLRNATDIPLRVDATALVTENLLIDTNGNVVPSGLTYDVQIRRFMKDSHGALASTAIEEFQLSRAKLITEPESGGFVKMEETTADYMPEAANDYGFASLRRMNGNGLPILTTLRERCIACHMQNIDTVFTFAALAGPRASALPHVSQLDPEENRHAYYVAHQKIDRADFRALVNPQSGKSVTARR
jgi:hypothetical protein